MILTTEPLTETESSGPKETMLKLPVELLESLCFNCENRRHCVFKEERKIYCELFE